jgi:hypothetical protein
VNIINDAFGYSKVFARLVPQSLTNYHKTVRKDVSSSSLSRCKADGESFLSRIITGDKTYGSITEP